MSPGDLVDVDRTTLRAFVVGDLLAVLAFVLVGELNHHVNPETQAVRFAATFLSFTVGWAVFATLAGAYGASVRASWRALVGRTAVAWLGADVVGQALRATSAFPGEASVAFFLVAGGFGFLFVLAMRAVARFVARRRGEASGSAAA